MAHISVWSDSKNTATAKTDLIDLLFALEERAPWQVARRYFTHAGIDGGAGWDAAVADVKFREDVSKIDLDGLYQRYLEHLCCGEKSVRRFKLSGAMGAALRKVLADNAHLTKLPRPRLRHALVKSKRSDPELVCVLKRPGGTYGIFRSIRHFEERKPLSTQDLPDAAKTAFSDYDELIAVKAVRYEAFGTIWVPNKIEAAEVSVDMFVDDTVHGMADFHQKMYSQLHSFSGSTSVISATNLFGAIKSLYDATEEGDVMELSFATTTGSVKTEKMRSRESLRKEKYHVGGIEALATEIEPYRIGVRWQLEDDLHSVQSAPELLLNGTLSMLGSTSPYLGTAEISKATDIGDFEFVREKLQEYA